jgi:hypothetical protein
MLALRVVQRPPATRKQVGAEVWRDAAGEVCAYGGQEAEGYWLVVPGVGQFLVNSKADVVDASIEGSVARELVDDTFRRIVLPLAVQARGSEVLHASAVLTGSGVVGFCGVSGSGKSTFAFALGKGVNAVYADDALALEWTPDGFDVARLPFRLSLRDPAATFLGAGPGMHEPGPLPERAPLHALCILEKVPVDRHSIARLEDASAFTAVLPHAYCFTLAESKRTRAMVDAYLHLVACVPVIHVRFPHDLKALPRIVKDINRVVTELPG